MAATHDAISNWFDRGIQKGATHMIVVCDTFDHEDYPVYVHPHEKVEEVEPVYGCNMQRVMEIYALHLPKDSQMDERRSFHRESAPDDVPQTEAE